MSLRHPARWVAVATAPLVLAVMVSGCSNDDAQDAAAPTPAVSATPTAESTSTPSPAPSLTSTPTPRPSSTSTSTPRPSSAAPTSPSIDDENGELAGQVIIEYPGKPLRLTTSTTPNNDVRDLQVRLNEVGYPVKVTGVFNADTNRVVIRFQKDNGLEADGVVGPATWAALFTFEGAEG